MTYSKQTWANDLAGGTPLSAARLNVMEAGIELADLHARTGTGSPEGSVTAPIGDWYTNTINGDAYLKTSGTGNTGWTLKGATGAAGVDGADGLPLEGWVNATSTAYAGIDPTGSADSATAMQAAFDDVPDGGTIVIPPGTYRIDARITVTEKSLNVIAYGALFVAGYSSTSQGTLFRFAGTNGTVRSVSTVTEAVTSGGEYGAGGANVWRTTLACSTTPTGISAGDLVRVVADDFITGHPSIRSGQTCHVLEVSGSNVVVMGLLRDPFTTTVRLAKMSDKRVFWRGGRFTHSATILAAAVGVGELFEFRQLGYPDVADMEFVNVQGPAMVFRRSYAWRADNLRFRRLHDEGSGGTQSFGNGINDAGELGFSNRLHGERVRHTYTTGADAASAGGALETFGRAYGTVVANSKAHGATATGFDTHGDGQNISFVNCTVVDCRTAYNLRGQYHKIIGGFIQGPHDQGDGCIVIDDNSTQDTYGHYIGGGLVVQDLAGKLLWANNDHGTMSVPNVIDGVHLIDRDNTDYLVQATNQVVHVGRITGDVSGTTTNTGSGGTIAALAVLSV